MSRPAAWSTSHRGDMRGAAGAGGAEGELALVRLHVRDEIGERIALKRRADRDHERRRGHRRDRREIAERRT